MGLMTTIADLSNYARRFCRDWGTFFQVDFPTLNASTLRMPHPLTPAASMVVRDNANQNELVQGTDYEVDERMGIARLLQATSTWPSGVSVEGRYYQWFLDEDLEFFATVMLNEHSQNRVGFSLSTLYGAEAEVLAIGTLVQALWSLTTEFSTDIDVSTPEGISIPAHQRFTQVFQLLQFWKTQYDEKAAMLNVGLKRIEMFNLRRISRLTNRYPPMYRSREVDDPRPPVRVRPDIDPIVPTPYEEEEEMWRQQYPENAEVFDLADGGWGSIGTMGGPF